MAAADALERAIRISRSIAGQWALVVALDGHSAAGKSTLATAMARRLDAAIVHVDDFYRDMAEADRLVLSPAEGVDRYFDWPRLREEALTPLRHRQRARFRCFDWNTGHGLTPPVTIEPREIVIVEGVYSARPEFDDLLDLKVLVHASDQERGRRRRERRDPHDWEARWEAAERLYFQSIRSPTSFDLVLPGDA